jgi:hypothetical protein
MVASRCMRMIFELVMATMTFLIFLYSTTLAVSLMYELDRALLGF